MNQLGKHAATIQEGLKREYDSLEPHQLSIYHGVSMASGQIIYDKKLIEIPEDWLHKFIFAKGAVRSGKTHADVIRKGIASISFSDYMTLVVRKRKEQLRNTYFKDFKDFCDRVTAGNPEWLILDERSDDGAIELLVRSVGKPSRIIFRIEPDGDDSIVRDSFKGYELCAFTIEEASQLKKITLDILRTRLSATHAPVHGTVITNPDYEGKWTTVLFDKCWKAYLNGEKPDMMPVTCRTKDVERHLPPTYIQDLEEQFKDDPQMRDMLLLGLDGISEGGRPVYKGYWNDTLHIDPKIRFDHELPLLRGWDFGFRVGAVGFWQLTKTGRLYKIAEFISENAYVEQFSDEVIEFTKKHFPFVPNGIEDFGDFAGTQDKDTGNAVQVISKRHKIKIKTTPFGNVDPQIDHIRALLSTLKDGKPRITVHPRCTQTILGFRYGYYYKEQRDGRVMSKPFKDGWFEHTMDADRYLINHAIPIGRERQKIVSYKAKGLADQRMAGAEQTLEDFIKAKKEIRDGNP